MENKSIKRVIAESTFLLSASSLFTKVLWLATSLIVLKILTVREFGIVELMFSVTAMMSIFSLPGLYGIVLNDVGLEKKNGNYNNIRYLLKQYFMYLFIPSIVAWIVMFFGADIITIRFSTLAGNLIRIMSFSFFVSPFWAVAQVLLMVESRFSAIALHQLAMAFSKFVFVAVLAFLDSLTVSWVLIAHVAMDYIGLIVVVPSIYFVIKNFGRSEEQVSISLWNIIIKHGKWAIFASYINDSTKSFRLWVIKMMLGTEAVGLYAAAFGMMSQIRTILPLQKILSSIIPQYDVKTSTFNKLVVKGIKYNLIGSLFLCVVASVFVPVLIYILLPQYIPSIFLFEIMLISMLPVSVGGVLSIVFYALKKQKNLFWANIIRLLSTMVLLPVLIMFFGLYGAAFELTTASLVFVFERLRVIKQELPNIIFSWNSLFKYDKLDLLIVSNIYSRFKNRFFINK